ncbi:hypothetical protein Tco_1231614 [Tanacetum coccineum]
MIQPEPEDLPKDNPKLEIAVLRHNMRMLVKDTRSQDGKDDKDNDKGSKSRSQSMKEQAYNKEQRERPRPHELNDESNLIDLMKEYDVDDGDRGGGVTARRWWPDVVAPDNEDREGREAMVFVKMK